MKIEKFVNILNTVTSKPHNRKNADKHVAKRNHSKWSRGHFRSKYSTFSNSSTAAGGKWWVCPSTQFVNSKLKRSLDLLSCGHCSHVLIDLKQISGAAPRTKVNDVHCRALHKRETWNFHNLHGQSELWSSVMVHLCRFERTKRLVWRVWVGFPHF